MIEKMNGGLSFLVRERIDILGLIAQYPAYCNLTSLFSLRDTSSTLPFAQSRPYFPKTSTRNVFVPPSKQTGPSIRCEIIVDGDNLNHTIKPTGE